MNYGASTTSDKMVFTSFMIMLVEMPSTLNVVVRYEMLDEDRYHVTIYMPRKNVTCDFEVTDCSQWQIENLWTKLGLKPYAA